MNYKLLLRMLCCVAVFAFYLFNLLQNQNAMHQLSMKIPLLAKDVKAIEEDNTKLQYEIACFESPEHLFTLMKKQEYSHLKYPLVDEVMRLHEGIAVKLDGSKAPYLPPHKTQPILAAGQY